MNEPTRCRGEEPSQLDLVFMKTPESRPSIHCLSQLVRSYHVTIKIVLQEETVSQKNEQFRNGKQNYVKANLAQLNKFNGKMNWYEQSEGKVVQEKYKIFLSKHKEGVQQFVPS